MPVRGGITFFSLRDATPAHHCGTITLVMLFAAAFVCQFTSPYMGVPRVVALFPL